MRKLATVQTVKEVFSIVDADKIELATMVDNAWQCVVGKGEFKPGDLGVYFEIDSLLPVQDVFSFMENKGRKKNADGSEGYRLRTIKLRGSLSQGLLLPVAKFPELHLPVDEGADLSEFLGVKLYEPPIPACLSGICRGSFPSFLKRTDQDRIQNVPKYLKLYADYVFEVSVKMDGSSSTFYYNNGVFGVCSHNIDLKDSETNTFWKMARKYYLERRLGLLGRNIAIQGETCGEGIQKNREKIKDQEMHVFDVWDIDKQQYMNPVDRMILIDELNMSYTGCPKLSHVPIIKTGPLATICQTVGDALNMAEGKGYITDNREGVVFKSYERDRNGQIISFKAISNKYLLGEKD